MTRAICARVAELVDALDLGSSGATRESSSLSFRTIISYTLSDSFQLTLGATGLVVSTSRQLRRYLWGCSPKEVSYASQFRSLTRS